MLNAQYSYHMSFEFSNVVFQMWSFWATEILWSGQFLQVLDSLSRALAALQDTDGVTDAGQSSQRLQNCLIKKECRMNVYFWQHWQALGTLGAMGILRTAVEIKMQNTGFADTRVSPVYLFLENDWEKLMEMILFLCKNVI